MAVSACSAASAQSYGLPHWTPGKKTLAKLDFAFRNDALWHGSPPDGAKYDRYYAGVTVRGRRMVRAEYSPIPGTPISCIPAVTTGGHATPQVCIEDHSHDRAPEVHVVPEEQLPGVKGGGCSDVYMLYDVAAERMVELHCNAPE